MKSATVYGLLDCQYAHPAHPLSWRPPTKLSYCWTDMVTVQLNFYELDFLVVVFKQVLQKEISNMLYYSVNILFRQISVLRKLK